MTTYTTVAALLADAARWTKGPLARDANGDAVGPFASNACAFCLMGAMIRVYPTMAWTEAMERLDSHLPAGFVRGGSFNDHPDTTHAMVLDVATKAGI